MNPGSPIHQTQAFGAAPISPTPNQTQMFGGGSPTPNQTQMFSGGNPMAGQMQTGPAQTAQAPANRKPYLAIMALAVVIIGAFIFKSVVPSSKTLSDDARTESLRRHPAISGGFIAISTLR